MPTSAFSALSAELDAGLAARASDWHFRGGEPCRIRVEGELVALELPARDESELKRIGEETLGAADVSFEYRGEFFRLHAYSAGGAPCLSFRHVPSRIRDLAGLGIPPAFERSALPSRRGLILVTGPSGSGKSTTLAASVDHLNRHVPGMILTFEDPIEFRHRNQKGIVRQMEKGRDFDGFAEAVRGALRSDPDAILIGEMRDSETIAAALTASETGHLVLGTLHCATAKDAVSRIADAFPADRSSAARAQLAKNLEAVLAQQLVRTPSGRRVAAFELMLATPAVRNLISGETGGLGLLGNEIATGRVHGMISMDQALEDLWRKRTIDRAEALRRAIDPAEIERRLTPSR